MNRIHLVAMAGLAAGCGDSGEPAWALDPIYLEPTDEGVYGLHSWELFSERWSRSFRGRYQVCTVIVELQGVEVVASSCEDCTVSWILEAAFVESECESPWPDDERFLSLSALALGPLDGSLDPADDPHPGQTTGAWVDYGGGWEPYGWAYPQALDHDGAVEDTGWDGEQPFAFLPAWTWDLEVP